MSIIINETTGLPPVEISVLATLWEYRKTHQELVRVYLPMKVESENSLQEFITLFNEKTKDVEDLVLTYGKTLPVLQAYLRFPKWTPTSLFDCVNAFKTSRSVISEDFFKEDSSSISCGYLNNPEISSILYAFSSKEESASIEEKERYFLENSVSHMDPHIRQAYLDFDYDVFNRTFIFMKNRAGFMPRCAIPEISQKNDYFEEDSYDEYDVLAIDLAYLDVVEELKEPFQRLVKNLQKVNAAILEITKAEEVIRALENIRG